MTRLLVSSEGPEESFLIAFFHESARRLSRSTISEPVFSLEEIRSELLQIQMECLEEAVLRHNRETQKLNQNRESSSLTHPLTLEQARDALRFVGASDTPIRLAVQEMNDAARLAFCRLALHSECIMEASKDVGECKSCQRHRSQESNDADPRRPVPLKRAGRMEREEVLEFIGLCDVAVRLDVVQQYLSAGNSSAPSGRLFPDVPLPDESSSSSSSSQLACSILPQDRLQYVQRLLLRAIGYDPAHGHAEIRRIFFDGPQRGNEFPSDVELADRFVAMSARMDAALKQATRRATLEAFGGGDTNITFVPTSSACCSSRVDGCEISAEEEALSPATRATATRNESQAKELLRLQPSTKLHQEILGELMMMDDEERMALLDEASRAEHEHRASSERTGEGNQGNVTHRAIPEEAEKTHRLLLSGRLWNAMLSQNGGLPPKFQ